MGTRSLIVFKEVINGKEYIHAHVYQCMDGYPDGVGYRLAKFLKNIKIINGITASKNIKGKFANGFGCLVAQFIAREKRGVGGFYICSDQALGGIEWTYNVIYNITQDNISIIIKDKKMSIDEFLKYCSR